MALPLLFFVIFSFIVSGVENIGKYAYILVAASFVQYICYFLILQRLFTQKMGSYVVIGITAVITFSIFLYAPPKLSNDVYRYLWDGLLQKSGYNPYGYVPGDKELYTLQEVNMDLYKHVDWRDKFTPYPPFAQIIFRGAYAWYEAFGLVGGKLMFALPFLLTAFFIYFFLDKKLYAAFILNPLLLLEVVANGHLDGWIVFFSIAALYLWHKEKYVLSSSIWILAVATKVYPIFFAPYLAIDLIRKRKFVSLFFSSLLAFLILYLLYSPFIKDSLFPITRYLTLPNEQEYNASIYRFLYEIMGAKTPSVTALAAKISGILFLITAVFLTLKRYSTELLLFVSILYLIFSPIVFPWYTVFLFGFAVFIAWESKSPRILYYFTLMQFVLTAIYFEPGIWILREIMLNLEYFLLLISILLYKKNRKLRFLFSLAFEKGKLFFSKRN